MKHHIDFELELRKNPYTGLYIALEGTEGSGKSTQVQLLAEYFQKKGKKVVVTREPRKEGVIGDMVQKVLLGELKMNPVGFQYLFSADRMLNHADVIEPALKKGSIVISDRCFWSAVVYGVLDKLDGKYSKKAVDQLLVAQSILSFYHQFITPDFLFYLSIPLETSLKRIGSKKEDKEIYESKEKIKKVIKGYEYIFKRFNEAVIHIDGTKPIQDITEEMIQKIEDKK